MLPIRNLSKFIRILPATRSFATLNAARHCPALTKVESHSNPSVNFQQIRTYAKGKDKQKKDNKKPVKVEINQDQLASVINIGQMQQQMDKVIDTMKDEFVKNLSLRSTTGAVETLKVNVDGKDVELQEIAQVIRKNPKTIVINMIGFPQLIPQVLQTINKSGMNLNPQQDGTSVFIPVPKVTKEHRENLAKNAKALFIKCRDGIKDVQNTFIRKVKNQKEISTDLNHSLQLQITAFGEKYIVEADKVLQSKQNELLGGKE